MLLCLILGQTVPRSVQDTCQNVLGGHTSVLTTDQLFSSPVLLSPIFPRPQHTHTLWDHPPNKLQTRVLGSGFASGEKPRLSSWYSKWP